MHERQGRTSFSPDALAGRFAEAEVSRLLRIRSEKGDKYYAECVGYSSLSYASIVGHTDPLVRMTYEKALKAIAPMIEGITLNVVLTKHFIIGLQKKMQEQQSSPKQQ